MEESKLLFEYRLGNAACCQYGQYEGFCIKIFADGTLIYNEFVIQNVKVKEEIFKLKYDSIKEIRNIINNSNVERIPDVLDNGSSDGDSNEFKFYKNGKLYRIIAWNIIDEEYDKQKADKIDEKYKNNYYNECSVMSIVNNVSKVLLEENIKFSLYRVEIKK